ncbi:FKBP-type peptidyl-prolyl cis-trans isomerase [Crocinitomicaceae bacterium]|jgi:FKBP-type peptidyl-prolyl cis-trans isomerase FkpA|nr:FKBP-type peptidyl-prolyl cis-trans isomerase [Crocinitomicaceae bacterium]
MRLAVTLCLLLFLSCRNEKDTEQIVETPKTESEWSSNHSVDFNQEIHVREEIDIALYLEHHKDLKMTQSSSGLRYTIIVNDESDETLAQEGDVLDLDLKIELLDGTLCYETDSVPERIVLGRSERESGLQEALAMMKKKDKAKLILPSYLAYGLLGDSESIPPQSIIIIEVELLNIKR